jgi:hypothetical protein
VGLGWILPSKPAGVMQFLHFLIIENVWAGAADDRIATWAKTLTSEFLVPAATIYRVTATET